MSSSTPVNDPQNDNVIVAMFRWWNVAFGDPEGFTEAAFSRYFSDDAILIANGAFRGQGLTELTKHYRAIQAAVPAVEMVLPVEDAFATPDRAFVHCREIVRSEGGEEAFECMAYATVSAGKMTALRVIGRPE